MTDNSMSALRTGTSVRSLVLFMDHDEATHAGGAKNICLNELV